LLAIYIYIFIGVL